jgi:three-Cys-motif partner protein
VVHGDANERLPEILNTINWQNKRALVFIDPFGFQLNWTTLETMLTNTKLDAWILVPVAGSNRVFPKELSRMDEHKENRLTEFFGSDEWKGFYQKTKTLFDEGTLHLTDDKEQKLLKLYIKKIRTIATYCSEPINLYDGTTHRFSLVFCMSNKSPPAIKLAEKLVSETRQRLFKIR